MKVELVTPCGHGSLEPHPSDNYNLPTEMCSPSRSTVSGFSPEAVQAAAAALYKFRWADHYPSANAAILAHCEEQAAAALAAAWTTDFGTPT